MILGVVRVLGGFVGTLAMLALYGLVLPLGLMWAVLVVVRFLPLTGQWRKRFKEWRTPE